MDVDIFWEDENKRTTYVSEYIPKRSHNWDWVLWVPEGAQTNSVWGWAKPASLFPLSSGHHRSQTYVILCVDINRQFLLELWDLVMNLWKKGDFLT